MPPLEGGIFYAFSPLLLIVKIINDCKRLFFSVSQFAIKTFYVSRKNKLGTETNLSDENLNDPI
jgi:hypothetical protein